MSLDAWSYSRYAAWALCPMKFKAQFIDKSIVVDSKAMKRGNEVHKDVATYVGTPLDKIVPPLIRLPEAQAHPFPKRLIDEARQMEDKVIEQQWAFDRSWEPTGWFAKGKHAAWFRNIIDLGVLYEDLWADIIDWKTGKKYDSNADQMELNAISLFCHFKPAIKVTTRMVYLDQGFEETEDFGREDLPKLIAKWEGKVRPMFEDVTFAPRPNEKCKWCDLAKSNGGVCRYG